MEKKHKKVNPTGPLARLCAGYRAFHHQVVSNSLDDVAKFEQEWQQFVPSRSALANAFLDEAPHDLHLGKKWQGRASV